MSLGIKYLKPRVRFISRKYSGRLSSKENDTQNETKDSEQSPPASQIHFSQDKRTAEIIFTYKIRKKERGSLMFYSNPGSKVRASSPANRCPMRRVSSVPKTRYELRTPDFH